MKEPITKRQREAVEHAAIQLAEARVRYARAFLINKISSDGVPVTDRTAEQRAVEATGDEITIAEVQLQLALIGATNR